MQHIGHLPLDERGHAILGGTRRFKFYATPALALASSGLAVATTPVHIGTPPEGAQDD
jgi:hypothetical protein